MRGGMNDSKNSGLPKVHRVIGKKNCDGQGAGGERSVISRRLPGRSVLRR